MPPSTTMTATKPARHNHPITNPAMPIPFPSSRGFLLHVRTAMCPKITARNGGKIRQMPPNTLRIPMIIDVTASPDVLRGCGVGAVGAP